MIKYILYLFYFFICSIGTAELNTLGDIQIREEENLNLSDWFSTISTIGKMIFSTPPKKKVMSIASSTTQIFL